jgi:putative ABC transport system permease protein
VNLQDSLKSAAPGVSPSHSRLRDMLVASEVCLSVIILVGAGLLGRSFIHLLSVDPGFRADRVLTFDLRLPQSKYPEAFQQRQFFGDLLERINALPETRSAALTSNLPLSGNSSRQSFTIEGRVGQEDEWARFAVVSAGYFQTMGITLRHGRDFGTQDKQQSPAVAIVNESMARKYWRDGDAVGKRILFGGSGPAEGPVVVGVVADVKQTGLATAIEPEFYLPYSQQPLPAITVVVRADADPHLLVAPLRSLVHALDKYLPIERVQTVDDILARSVAEPRLVTQLMGAFSALALVLVTVGIYGVISYSVSQRMQEIGIRMAIGAEHGNIFRMVVAQSIAPTSVGVVAGLVTAWGLTRLIATRLFDVRPTDPVTFAATAVVLIGVALLASYIPARRAAGVELVVALRHE